MFAYHTTKYVDMKMQDMKMTAWREVSLTLLDWTYFWVVLQTALSCMCVVVVLIWTQ